MSLRRKARETALQILYKIDMSEGAPSVEGLDGGPLAPGTEARRYCDELVAGVTSRLDEINRTIEAHSENWTIERNSALRSPTLRSKDVPYKVVIDEAVELAKRYGTEESGAFVNGIIDKVRKKTGSQGA